MMTTDHDPSGEPTAEIVLGGTPSMASTAEAPAAAPAGPRASRAPKGNRRPRRHAADASRVLVAGLATASTFGLVAVLGQAQADHEQTTELDAVQTELLLAEQAALAAPAPIAPTTTAAPVIVIRRTFVPVGGQGASSTGAVPGSTGATGGQTRVAAAAPAPAAPAPVVTAAPRRQAPVARSSSS